MPLLPLHTIGLWMLKLENSRIPKTYLALIKTIMFPNQIARELSTA